MKRQLLALMMAVAAAPAGVAAQEQPPPLAVPEVRSTLETRADEVVALINAKAEPGAIFTARFRAAVPDAQLKALTANLTAQFGAALAATLDPRDGTRARLEVRFERGIAKGSIAIAPGEDNRVSELLFTSVEALRVEGDTPQAIAAELAALPGAVNAWFGPLDGKSAPILALAPDKPLALGSAFKLYVLAALAEDVKTGRRKWSDVVPLNQKSLPSGQLQSWPQGAPLTLHTLAGLMISVSDNTATDQLIATLGRARILKAMRDSGHADPAANTPFLGTRELFALKADPALTAAWRSGNAEARAALLKGIAGQTPALEAVTAAFAGGPKALDLEWFAAPADLVKLFAFLRRTGDPKAFEILAINPQTTAAIKEKWRYAGFKGGSEPGVMNLTWLVTDPAGRDWVLTVGWNNPAATVDEGKLLALGQRILLLPR